MTEASGPAGVPARGIEVIGAGFGRTGTASLQQALQRLGFDPCDHMHENFARPERFALWEEAVRGKDAGEPIDWRPLLATYRAIVDWPGTYFWRELTSAHPAAKVVLTVRDPDRRYDSIAATIFPLLEHLEADGGPALPGDVVLARTFPGIVPHRDQCTAVFAAHNAAVCAAIAPSGCWSSTSKRGGGRCAPSWACPCPTASRSRTATTPRSSTPTNANT